MERTTFSKWAATILTTITLAETSNSFATVVSLTSISDAFVAAGSADPNSGNPEKNYGGAGALQISASGSTKGEMQSLMKFDLASAKLAFDAAYGTGNWTVESITLQLGTNFGTQGSQPNNPIFNAINAGLFSIDWLANDNWIEGTGNPASPTTDGITFSGLASLMSLDDETLGIFGYTPVGNTTIPTIVPATYGLSLEPGILSDIADGEAVSFRAYAGNAGVSFLFNSRSFGTAANRPTLIVSAIPEPSSVALTGLAAVTLINRRRRHAQTS